MRKLVIDMAARDLAIHCIGLQNETVKRNYRIVGNFRGAISSCFSTIWAIRVSCHTGRIDGRSTRHKLFSSKNFLSSCSSTKNIAPDFYPLYGICFLTINSSECVS